MVGVENGSKVWTGSGETIQGEEYSHLGGGSESRWE
jgi:hypothetical protein